MKTIAVARAAVFSALFDIDGKSQFARSLDKFITWLIIANLAALVIEHIPALYVTHEASLGLFDRLSIYVFTLEYVLRLFSAGGDPRFQGKRFATMRFAVTPFALIDLLVIAPYWLHLLGILNLDLRLLRILRLLRLLKLLRDVVPAVQEFKKMNFGRTFRQKIDALMNETPTSGRLHKQIDFILIIFILVSVAAVFLETVPFIHEPLKEEFFWFDTIAIAVFTVEYLLRLYAAPEQDPNRSGIMGRLSFMKKPTSIVDLVSIMPYYLQLFFAADIQVLRVLRVLRVMKLARYNNALITFGMVFKREKRAFIAAMFVTALITVLSGAIVYGFEHAAQPEKFDTLPRAMYWAVITLASVGYGDISPITPVGQAFTMVLALLGIGIVALPAGILGSAFSDQLHQQREQMLKAVEDAFADGVLTETEANALEEERIRLHLSEEQFEILKARALARHSSDVTAANTIFKASEEIRKLREAMHVLPIETAIAEIERLNLPDAEKAALRVLLK
jgi:hypothetical protein